MKKRRKNPVPASSALKGKRSEILEAARLFEDFTGQEVTWGEKHPKPEIPDVLLHIGKVDGILYSTRRDGVNEKYIHKFAAKSRPIMAVSHDGKMIVLLGGSYTFTERGIVDKT